MKADDKGEAMLSSPEAAARLGVSPQTVKRMAQRGELPAVKVGKRYKFRPVDLAAYLDRARVKPE
jgi:excisionase family DNA binding protein